MFKEAMLLRKLNRRDAEALRLVYHRTKDRLLTVAASITGDTSTAVEVLRETFAGFAGKCGRLPLGTDVTGLLVSETYELACSRLRAKNYEVVEDERLSGRRPRPAPQPGGNLGDERFGRINRMLARIPFEQRVVVVLRLCGGLQFGKIAALENVSPGTARGRYSYGLEKLRDLFIIDLPHEKPQQALADLAVNTTPAVDREVLSEAGASLRKAPPQPASPRAAVLLVAGTVFAAAASLAFVLWLAGTFDKPSQRQVEVPGRVLETAAEGPEPGTSAVERGIEATVPTPGTQTVTIELVELETDEPVAGKTLSIAAETGGRPGVTRLQTDQAGLARLRLAPGNYSASVDGWKKGAKAVFSQDFSVRPGGEALAIKLGASLRPMVYGWLVDRQGGEHKGHLTFGMKTTATDDSGEFLIPEPNEPAGTSYVVYAFNSDKTMGRALAWNKGRSPDELEIILEPTAAVLGRLVDSAGSPVKDAELSARIAASPGAEKPVDAAIPFTGITDEEGYFAITGIPVGLPVEIVFADPNGEPVVRRLERLTAGHGAEVELIELPGRLAPQPGADADASQDETDAPRAGASLAGTVTDGTGLPLPGFEVWATNIDGFEVGTSSLTDPNGRYRLVDLPQGAGIIVWIEGPEYGEHSFEIVVDGNDFDVRLPNR
jgi:RNA polymerase sigma-70 factor (ECF subfamily)